MILKYILIIKIINQIFCFRQPSYYIHNLSHYLKSEPAESPNDNFSWIDTLNLPKASCNFYNFAALESDTHDLWNIQGSYLKSIVNNISKNRDTAPSIKFLLDGPPYANGHFHMGHLLNRTLKDIVIRFWLSQGHVPLIIPGWDCHGLPIELKANALMGPESLVEKCQAVALSSIRQQALTISRLGCWAFWALSYGTLLPLYKNLSTSVFNHLLKEGKVQRGPIPVLYSPSAQSVLADSEIKERRVLRTCSFVPYQLSDPRQIPSLKNLNFDKAHLIAYTTEPWTLFGNQALAVRRDSIYNVYQKGNDVYISNGENPYSKGLKVAEILGSELINMSYLDTLSSKENKIVDGEMNIIPGVATGIIHLSGAHSISDFLLLVNNGVTSFRNLIDESGKLIEYPTIGVYSHEMDDLLRSKIDIAHIQTIIKKLFCSRTGGNVFTRIIDQYWINLEDIKKEALNAVNNISIVPKQSKNFLYKALLHRPSLWCLSRQRPWGCSLPLSEPGNMEVVDVWFESGINWMYNQMAYDFMSKWLFNLTADNFAKYKQMVKLPDNDFTIGDNEFYKDFDNHVKDHITLPYLNPSVKLPKFLMIEGIDQNRGWFQSSINMSIALNAELPMDKIVVHGFIIDERDKNKISKSKIDYPQADQLLDAYGADTLRLFVASSDFHQKDVYLSKSNIERADQLRSKLSNTFKFILGLSEYCKPDLYINNGWISIDYPLDEDILIKLKKLQQVAREHYETTHFSKIIGELHYFLKYLSGEYLTIMKDVIYTNPVSLPRCKSAFNTIFFIGKILSQVIAPIAPHITQYFNTLFDNSWDLHEKWVEFTPSSKFVTELNLADSLRSVVIPHLQNAVNDGVIKYFGQAKIMISCNQAYKELIDKWDGINSDDMRLYLNVADIDAIEGDPSEGLEIKVENAGYCKCDRCWLFRKSVNGKTINNTNHMLCSKCYDMVKDM